MSGYTVGARPVHAGPSRRFWRIAARRIAVSGFSTSERSAISRRAPPIVLSPRQQAILDQLSRSRTLPKRLAERVLFVLWSAEGQTCAEQAKRMDVDPQRSRRWRKRWFEAQERFAGAEAKNVSDDEYEVLLCEELADEERSGAPPKFSAEQLAQLITLACKEPKGLGLPVTLNATSAPMGEEE